MANQNLLSKNQTIFGIVSVAVVILVGGLLWWYLSSNIVARVNGEAIYKKTFEKVYDAQKIYNEKQGIQFNDDDLKQQVLDEMIESVVIKQEASERDIEVTSEDIDAMFESLVEANGGLDEFSKQIEENFGLSASEYKNYKVKPALFQEKLRDKVTTDENYTKSSKEQAEKAKAELETGADFAEVAKKYSDDEFSKTQNGDMGWMEKGQAVKEFEDRIFSLGRGQVSDVFETVLGYHIVKITDTRAGAVRVSQILVQIKPFSEWVQDRIEESKITKHI